MADLPDRCQTFIYIKSFGTIVSLSCISFTFATKPHTYMQSIWMRFLILLGDNNMMFVCRYLCNICRNVKIKEICLGNKCIFYFPCKNLFLILASLELQSYFKTRFISVHVNENQSVGRNCRPFLGVVRFETPQLYNFEWNISCFSFAPPG